MNQTAQNRGFPFKKHDEDTTILGDSKEITTLPEENFIRFENRFGQSDLGKLYLPIPWKDLVRDFKIREDVNGSIEWQFFSGIYLSKIHK